MCLIDGCRLHDSQELLDVDDSIIVLIELVDHGLQLVVAQRLAEFARHATQVLERYRAGLVVVEQGERLADLLLGIAIGNLEQKTTATKSHRIGSVSARNRRQAPGSAVSTRGCTSVSSFWMLTFCVMMSTKSAYVTWPVSLLQSKQMQQQIICE